MPAAPAASLPPAASTPPAAPAAPAGASPPAAWHGRWIAAGAVALTAIAVAALTLAWNTQQRLKAAEAELVRRQQDAGGQALEARTLARQAEATARDAAAKIGVLEARVAETSLQRTQLEELIQSLSRSRDENVLADVDAAIRVALQQSAITGSVEPLAAALRQADERLARYQAPRLERVRRAVAQDLDRVKAAGVVDLPTLAIRLDEAIRVVDELPLLSSVDARGGGTRREPAAAGRPVAPGGAPAASAAAAPAGRAPVATWPQWLDAGLRAIVEHVWGEIRALVRVTRVDQPEAALLAPDERYFLRENLKLRLLNARLALLSRQIDTVQSDLREAQSLLDRYFDRGSRRVIATAELLRQVSQQAQKITVPRPDATLAALAAAVAGR
jgi:uroporphyrin-3 C-methyltransferase